MRTARLWGVPLVSSGLGPDGTWPIVGTVFLNTLYALKGQRGERDASLEKGEQRNKRNVSRPRPWEVRLSSRNICRGATGKRNGSGFAATAAGKKPAAGKIIEEKDIEGVAK